MIIQVVIKYESSQKHYEFTPSRKGTIISLSKRNYRAVAKRVATSDNTSGHILSIITQHIRAEMNEICSKNMNLCFGIHMRQLRDLVGRQSG